MTTHDYMTTRYYMTTWYYTVLQEAGGARDVMCVCVLLIMPAYVLCQEPFCWAVEALVSV